MPLLHFHRGEAFGGVMDCFHDEEEEVKKKPMFEAPDSEDSFDKDYTMFKSLKKKEKEAKEKLH